MLKKGFTLWFTGWSGAGKSTLAEAMEKKLIEKGIKPQIMDGDEVRMYLTHDLGFSKEDRDENIRRIGYVCKLLTQNGVMVISAAISPYKEMRDKNRELIKDFIEVYVKCSQEKLVERDPKGLYKKALAGEIKSFTGISDPYEAPENPELVVDTGVESIEESMAKIFAKLKELGYLDIDA